MEKIIACIPNFSEGRNKKKIHAIVKVITKTPGILVLDRESDYAHNRSVVTFVGPPEAVMKAAYAATEKAAQLIDLRRHHGEHPRMGATDVIPFVPLQGSTIEECIVLAEKLGEKIGRELKIPVYLYEKAARRPERENLASIRRGEYEGIKREIGRNRERTPDFGPKRLGSAGATAIGVRDPLIAFNVNLKSTDVDIARAIAKKVRFKDGGFKCVKALGFDLKARGMVQVSMNLTNYRETPPHVVFDAIRTEVEKYGVEIAESEIVGLIPQDALFEAAQHYLQLKHFTSEQIIELTLKKKMEESNAENHKENSGLKLFIDEVASRKPVPGGGSVAALAATLAAALTSMVANLTLGSPRYQKVHSEAKKILQQSEKLRMQLFQLVEEDSAAYAKVMAAYQLPKKEKDVKARSRVIQRALLNAAEVPAHTAETALKLLKPLKCLSRLGNRNAISDCGVALSLIEAAVNGALLNVAINLKLIADKRKVKIFAARIEKMRAKLTGDHHFVFTLLRQIMQDSMTFGDL